jgi:hypothetical protein
MYSFNKRWGQLNTEKWQRQFLRMKILWEKLAQEKCELLSQSISQKVLYYSALMFSFVSRACLELTGSEELHTWLW